MGGTDRDFTLRQLRIFISAARAESFSQAAAELGISQPAVSEQIALLESRLGRVLFLRRMGTTPQLTAEGAQLLEKAGGLIDTSRAMCSDAGRHQQSRVSIHVGPRVLDIYLKPMLPQLYRELPGLHIDLLHGIQRLDVPSALERGRVDIVVYTLEQVPGGWENSRVIGEVATVMAGPPGIRQRLESGEERMEDIQFILPSAGRHSETMFERLLQRLNIKLRKPIIYLQFTDVIEQMVEDGQGATMLMHEQLAGGIAAGRVEVFGPRLPSFQRVIARSSRAPATARIIEERLVKAMSTSQPAALAM